MEAAVSSHGFRAEGTAPGCIPSDARLASGAEPLLPWVSILVLPV